MQEVKKIAQAMARQTERDESEVCSHAIYGLSMLDCGGVKMLARMVWGTYAVKIEVQMCNCLIVEGSKMFARMVWGTYNHQHGNLTKLLNSVQKLSAPECPVDNFRGASLS